MGHLFVLDRATGERVYPVEERSVPQTRLRGERTSPTQPFPIPALRYAQQGFSDLNRNTLTPDADAFLEKILEEYGEAGLFPPPSEKGDVVLPQFNGGRIGAGILRSHDVHPVRELVRRGRIPENGACGRKCGSSLSVRCDGPPADPRPERISDQQAAVGTLTAIGLNRPAILWQEPLGTYPKLEAEGYGKTGTFNMGGSVVTAGGLVFIAASMDERLHAYDKETGELL